MVKRATATTKRTPAVDRSIPSEHRTAEPAPPPPLQAAPPDHRMARSSRVPIITGQGAVRVKTFYARLQPEDLDFFDDQINQWLEDHPEYEVKFVTSSVGTMEGGESTLIVNVWT